MGWNLLLGLLTQTRLFEVISKHMVNYINHNSPLDVYFRSIVLFGRNVASYKFSLALSLLELASQGKNQIRMDELAVPYSNYLLNHIKQEKKQGTFASSKFLTSCQKFLDGDISKDVLISKTVELGFMNVIDAFHVVNQGEIPLRFFIDERKQNGAIKITDNLFSLLENFQAINLQSETEARWNLVETAWSQQLSPNLLMVNYDSETHKLFVNRERIRKNVTSCRSALNGYQKGKCFYCFSDISIEESDEVTVDVDHFFPNTLKKVFSSKEINLDGVWNLVLSCKQCNRGENGKHALIPDKRFLERLNNRNNFLINSHHPLRDTLIIQTGATEKDRIEFLDAIDKNAISYLFHRWSPKNEFPGSF